MQNTENMLISIITVCFNEVGTIARTIKSVADQTYKNIEYIIIDGGSTDGTIQILERYQEYISIIVSEKDKGIYDAMNKGIGLAQGDYIGIINADDWYEKDAVEKVVQISRNISENTGVISGQIRFMDGEQSFLSKKKNISDIWIEMPVSHPATFIKKSIYDRYGKYNTHYKIAADYDLIFRLYISQVKFCLCDEILANFRIGGASSTRKNILLKEDVEILKHYQKYCDEPDKVQNSVRRKESIRFFYTASKEIFYEILDIVSKNDDEIFVFGCGYWGRELAKILDMKGIVIRGFLDNNSALWGMNIMDYVVEAPDKLYKLPEARVIIAIQGDTLGIEKQIVFLNRKVKCTSLEDIWRRMYCLCKENKN